MLRRWSGTLLRVKAGVLRTLCSLFLLCATSGALAQDATEPGSSSAKRLEMPRLKGPPIAEYPAGATGDARVVLELVVSDRGTVAEARAIDGPEVFRRAAESAALEWRFEPARRDGQPIAAKIRFELRYAAPPESGSPATDAASDASARPPARARPAAAVVYEVTVTGDRIPPRPANTTLTRAEVREIPGTFGDPFRAIEGMPGVTPIASGVPFFYVRGAPPGNVGYFVDGVRVPYLFHVGLGPSVLHPGMIERVELYSGGYPARFGRFAGGIVSGVTTAPRAELHGEYNVRLFDLGTLAETGFADGRGTALAAFRYSYTAALLSLVVDEVQLDYRDYEARVTYDLTEDDRFTVLSFGAYDLLGERHDDVLFILFGSEFYRLDTRYDKRLGPDSKLQAAVTLGWEQTRIPDQPRNASLRMVNARVEAAHGVSDAVLWRGGADVLLEGYRADDFPNADPDDPSIAKFNRMFPARDDVTVGAWTDFVLQAEGVEVTPGVRVDAFRSGNASAVGVDPRLASRIEVAESVSVHHALGIAHQPPSFLIPLPGLAIGQLRGGLQRSVQASAGVEAALDADTVAQVTVFENVFLDMTDTLALAQPGDDIVLKDQRSQGSAHGVELYLKRKLTRRVGGYASYTLSRSVRSVGRQRFPSSFDRTHVASTAVGYDLGRRWRAGAKFTFYTGAPSLPNTRGLIAPPRLAHPPRDPAFHRLDVRLEKKWPLAETAWIAFVAEVLNTTLRTETVLGEEIGPVTIPSVGVEGAY